LRPLTATTQLKVAAKVGGRSCFLKGRAREGGGGSGSGGGGGGGGYSRIGRGNLAAVETAPLI